jgi:hypothetical protein
LVEAIGLLDGREGCDRAEYFTLTAGFLNIIGPDRLTMDVRAGVGFHLMIHGNQMSVSDRVIIVDVDDAIQFGGECDNPGIWALKAHYE